MVALDYPLRQVWVCPFNRTGVAFERFVLSGRGGGPHSLAVVVAPLFGPS